MAVIKMMMVVMVSNDEDSGSNYGDDCGGHSNDGNDMTVMVVVWQR